jgi:hypothetical protein
MYSTYALAELKKIIIKKLKTDKNVDNIFLLCLRVVLCLALHSELIKFVLEADLKSCTQ